MTAWLIRRFIKNPENTGDQQVRQAYGTLGSITGMALNLFLSLIKILMGFLTGSVAVTADGINNLSDAGGSLIALIAVRMAQKPLDEDHPFGHGRIEYLGALSGIRGGADDFQRGKHLCAPGHFLFRSHGGFAAVGRGNQIMDVPLFQNSGQ